MRKGAFKIVSVALAVSSLCVCSVSGKIKKIKIKMFNLYQHMNRNNLEGKEPTESATTGHDRFYQERTSRSSFKKKKKPVCRRAQSVAEMNPAAISAANKRASFRARSVSSEQESEEDIGEKAPLVTQKIDSIAKLLFNKSFIGSPSGSVKCSPIGEQGAVPRVAEHSVESAAALAICNQYLAISKRYEMIAQLNDVGSRADKFWFAVKDCSIKAERLLTMTPLNDNCPIEATEHSKTLIMELFRALHHPYIYPVLDIAFYCNQLIAVVPFNGRGSLKDLIYKSSWNDDWTKKYEERSSGLPLWQVGRLGRQILEGLLFLKEKGFPSLKHLQTSNIIIQNGVARISGLENTLAGLSPRCQYISKVPTQRVETISFGRVLFEMSAGYELDAPRPQPGHLQLDLDKYPQVVETLELIFAKRTPLLHELLMCELFRKIDLREMKGSCLPNFSQRLSNSCVSLLGEVARRQMASAALRSGMRSEGSSPMGTPTSIRRRFAAEDFNSSWYW